MVQTKDGSLLAAWYAGSGERTADDVVIEGAWLPQGQTAWGPKFLMADTPGYPDCNPALFAAPDDSLWLFWPTILDHRWEGALLKFARCEQPDRPAGTSEMDASRASCTSRPKALPTTMKQAIAGLSDDGEGTVRRVPRERGSTLSRDELYQRLGWMPRVHPVVLPSGRWILPLYTDTFSASIMAISDDRGETWTASKPLDRLRQHSAQPGAQE